MASILGDLPSFDPQNFSQHRPSDPSNPSRMIPTTYRPTHNRTLPPPDQVITTEVKNILIRSFYQRAEEKLRPKRPASEHLVAEHAREQAFPRHLLRHLLRAYKKLTLVQAYGNGH